MGAGVEEVGAGRGTVPKALRGAAAFAHRKSEAPGAFQARDEGRSQRPGQGQSQLLRRQSSPALSREVSTASLPWALYPKGQATAFPSPRCQVGVLGREVLYERVRVSVMGV